MRLFRKRNPVKVLGQKVVFRSLLIVYQITMDLASNIGKFTFVHKGGLTNPFSQFIYQ